MIREHGATVWPLVCVLVCLLVLRVTAPRQWEQATRGQAVAQSPGCGSDTLRPAAPANPASWPSGGSTRLPRVLSSASLPQLAVQGTSVPDDLSTTGTIAGEDGELQQAQPSAKYAGLAAASNVSPSQLPTAPLLARGIVAHQEVFSSPNGKRAEGQKPEGQRAVESTQRDSPILAEQKSGQSPSPPPPSSEGPAEVAVAEPAWQTPVALIERLDKLADEPSVAPWARETGRLVQKLGPDMAAEDGQPTEVIEELRALQRDAEPLAAALDDGALARELRRTAYALSRRLDVWQQVVTAQESTPLANQQPAVDPQRLRSCLAEIDAVIANSSEGAAWRQFLLFDALKEWSARRQLIEELPVRALAARVVQRLSQTPLSHEQRRFVASRPIARLRDQLRRWMAEPVGSTALLDHLERYEQSRLGSDARLLAADWGNLRLSADARRRQLANRIQSHYRNANLRVAVSETLLNRFVPDRAPEHSPVRDQVLGVPVQGQSTTFADVRVRLLPHPSRAQVALEIAGQVDALTRSTSGPATFYNNSQSVYTARKPVEIHLTGIRFAPAEVDVHNRTQLRGLQTDFDGIPLVGSLVKGVARSQHEQKRPAAAREVESKVAGEVRRRIDSEADAQLAKATELLRQRIVDPLEALALEPTMIGAETTPQRLAIRLRLAGEDQLGGHTPRPRAPSDSLASLQIHETAINNVLRRLQLEGRSFYLPELADHIAARLDRPLSWEIDEDSEDVKITFARQDALVVHCEDGRVALRLSIARMSKRPRRWRNFEVHACYRPQVNGRSVEFVRDGVVGLRGIGAQLALRGIFNRVFSKKRPWQLTPAEFVDHSKLADLSVTQFVIDDGWIGVALGPQRVAQRPDSLRR